MKREHPSEHKRHWSLDPEVVFLNHGSFGATPVRVLEAQAELRDRMEREPVLFLARQLEERIDETREVLARFLSTDAASLAFVPNATGGVNSVLRSLRFGPEDELLVTDHEYRACRNTLDFVAERWGANVVQVEIPFPLENEGEVVSRILDGVTPKTRLALFDHVTSPTGLVLPIERLIRELEGRGVDCLIDGAHAPGMLPLDLSSLSPAYYTGNCHKWICAPKGAAFLWVREDKRPEIRPLAISHGANWPTGKRSRFHLEFDWTGTHDPTPYLCIPEAIETMGSLLEGGWTALREHNRALALEAQALLAEALEIPIPAPKSMIGSLASFPLPDGGEDHEPTSPLYLDPLQVKLFEEDKIEVPIAPFPAPPKRVLRISAQLYNRRQEYELLADRLRRTVLA